MLPRGTKVIPLMPNEKRPLEGRRVEDTVTDDPHEIRRLRELGYGLGLLLSENDLSVADFDDKNAGRVFWREHYKEGIIQAASETRRGAPPDFQRADQDEEV